MASPDPYATLGVSRDASDAEIKRAFRKLARKYHPDRNPDDSAAEAKFKEVQAAYETIGDASKRQEYDQKKRMENMFGRGGRSPFGGGMGGGGGDMMAMIRARANKMQGPPTAAAGPPTVAPVPSAGAPNQVWP